MADVTQEQVVEYIKGISVLELSQLVKTLEEELGVSAAANMPSPREAKPSSIPGSTGMYGPRREPSSTSGRASSGDSPRADSSSPAAW